MLADLGRRLAPRRRDAGDAERESLALLNTRRGQLVAMRRQERTRRTECAHDSLQAGLDAQLAWLNTAINEIDAAIAACVQASPALRETEARLRSVPGVGPVTAATLIAVMPELGTCSPKTVAALGGLAPWNNDSGAFSGKRSVRGGRKRVRDALYMAAVSASRTKTCLGDAYRKLRAHGKPAKLAFIALARKMLVILNAIERDKQNFKPA